MKMYNTLSNVFNLATNEYGKATSWSCDSAQCIFDNYLNQFLKIGSEPSDFSNVSSVKNLSDVEQTTYSNFASFPHVFLSDGSALFITDANLAEENRIIINFVMDTNGIKGPNVIGRDLLFIQFINDKLTTYEYFDEEFEDKPGVFIYSNCDPNETRSEDNGMGCTDRLLQEGKMNY